MIYRITHVVKSKGAKTVKWKIIFYLLQRINQIPEMQIVETAILTEEQKEAVIRLWNAEYPAALNYAAMADFDKYLDGLAAQEHLLLTNDADEIEGWAFRFVRDNEVWFAIIVSGSMQGKGYGKRLLDELKSRNPVLNGWVADHNRSKKINGVVYESPMGFYLKNGFVMRPEIRLETAQLSAVKIEWYK